MQHWLIASTNGLQVQGGAPEFVPDGARILDADETTMVLDALTQGKEISLEEGQIVIADIPPPSPEQVLDHYRAAIQAHIDSTAQSRGYDSGTSCASYAASTVTGWAAEASAFIVWRDAVWQQVLGLFGDVQAGKAEIPALEDLIADLPTIDWTA